MNHGLGSCLTFEAISSYVGLCLASSRAMLNLQGQPHNREVTDTDMFKQKKAIQEVPSDWASFPSRRGSDRLNGPMLSMPRKPPSKMLLPSASFLFTHLRVSIDSGRGEQTYQVKLSKSFWKTLSKKSKSSLPNIFRSILNTRNVAQACTGGLTSPKFHS